MNLHLIRRAALTALLALPLLATAQDKEAKMKDLEGYFREISTDITDLLADMTQEERSMLKAKVSALATKL